MSGKPFLLQNSKQVFTDSGALPLHAPLLFIKHFLREIEKRILFTISSKFFIDGKVFIFKHLMSFCWNLFAIVIANPSGVRFALVTKCFA